MNKYLVEGLEKFLKSQEEKKEKFKKPVKKLKESLEADEEKKIYKALKVAQSYIDASEDIPTFEEFKNLLQEDPQSVINYLEAPCEDWEDYEVPEIVVIDALNSADKIQADHPEITFERSIYITDPRKDLEEGCKKELKEETNMDKINKYLVSIGEAPITESIEEDEKKSSVTPRAKGGVSNFDKIKKVIGITESKKAAKRPMNLMESLNHGFLKLYGDFDDTKSLNEACDKKARKPLKEYKDMGQDLGEYQKWVDYDMKKYHKISDDTMSKIKKAGLSVVKDQYGQYEVIAKEADKDSKR